MESSPQTEHMLRCSKRQNLVVFGIAESSACATPEALAAHVQGLPYEGVLSSAAPLVSCAYRLGKWKAAQKKPGAVLVELTMVSAKHRAFKASSCLRANRIRLDEDFTSHQMQLRKGLSSHFLGLKIRGFKPFFRGTTLKYRDGGVVRQCAKGGLTRSDRQLVQFLALAQYRGLSIPVWQWILLWSCGRLVFWSAGSLILDLPCLLPWGLWGLTASFRTVPAPLPQLLGL